MRPFARKVGLDMPTGNRHFWIMQEKDRPRSWEEKKRRKNSYRESIHDIYSAEILRLEFIMLNLHLVASGPKETVMTSELLLAKPMAGKLKPVLTKYSDLIRQKELHPLKNWMEDSYTSSLFRTLPCLRWSLAFFLGVGLPMCDLQLLIKSFIWWAIFLCCFTWYLSRFYARWREKNPLLHCLQCFPYLD